MKKAIKILVLGCLLVACKNHTKLSPADYLKYMESLENGYVKKITSGVVEYEVQLAPAQYMACRQYIKDLEQGDFQAYQKRVKEISGYTFFLIKIKQRGIEQQSINDRIAMNAMAEQRVMYYQQDAAANIKLDKGKATLMPVTYLYEDNYGLAPYNTIVVGFSTTAENEDMQIEFNDKYTQTPFIKAGFTKKELEELPALNIKMN